MAKASKRKLQGNPLVKKNGSPVVTDRSIEMPEGQVDTIISRTIEQEFQGPLPPPNVLGSYEKIEPGTANRIITLAENETKHRHNMEHKMLDAEIAGQQNEAKEVMLGQIFGFIIGLSTIVGGVYAAVKGAQWPGAIIGTTGVTGLVSVFVLGRKNAKDNKQPAEK
jgi:uncharacterized membrane protein